MQGIFRRLSILLAIFFVASFGLVVHASAMPNVGHDMSGMNHAPESNSVYCATHCANNTFYKDELVFAIREDEDDEPTIPYYIALRSAFVPTVDTDYKPCTIAVKPPPKVPIYILNSVFRV